MRYLLLSLLLTGCTANSSFPHMIPTHMIQMAQGSQGCSSYKVVIPASDLYQNYQAPSYPIVAQSGYIFTNISVNNGLHISPVAWSTINNDNQNIIGPQSSGSGALAPPSQTVYIRQTYDQQDWGNVTVNLLSCSTNGNLTRLL